MASRLHNRQVKVDGPGRSARAIAGILTSPSFERTSMKMLIVVVIVMSLLLIVLTSPPTPAPDAAGSPPGHEAMGTVLAGPPNS